MTTGDPQSTTTTTQPAAPTPPPAPAVDVEAIKQEAVTAAKAALGDVEKLAEEKAQLKVREAFKKITGEDDQPQINPILQEFVKDPGAALLTVKDMAKKEAKDELKAEAKETSDFEAAAREASQPFIQEYPEIAQHLDLVDGFTRNELDKGTDFKEAVKAAFKKTAERLGLRNAKELAVQKKIQAAGLPPVSGGYGAADGKAEFNEAASTAKYMQGLRERSKFVRSRKA